MLFHQQSKNDVAANLATKNITIFAFCTSYVLIIAKDVRLFKNRIQFNYRSHLNLLSFFFFLSNEDLLTRSKSVSSVCRVIKWYPPGEMTSPINKQMEM